MSYHYDPEQYSIAELVPHAAPMILLDGVDSWTLSSAVASVTITPQSPFACDLGVPAYVGIEYMAQAISAQAGVTERLQNSPVQIGFLVGSRRYTCNVSHFPIGAKLSVEIIESLVSDTGLSVYECSIKGRSNGCDILASASLNVFLPENAEDFLGEESA